jgi:hypothetical protein
MPKRSYRIFIAAGVMAATAPAYAEKKWQGQVRHIAVLGENFVGAKILLGTIAGRCSHEFGDLPLQATVPPSGGAPELALALGPTDVISAEISTCKALPRELMGTGLPATHIARTEAHFLASLRVIDLATGSELTVLTLRADPARQNESQTGSPEAPGTAELIDIATRQGIEQARHLYSAWKENQELVFMDDKECNLRQSWDLLKADDYSGLLRSTKANAEGCHAAPKIEAAAWYDLAIANLLLQNYDGALTAFRKSKALHGISQADDLAEQCQRNKALAGALARQVVAWTQMEHKNAKPTAEVQTGIIFDNDLVVKLMQGDVADADIIRMIGREPNRFALGPEDLAKMRDAGVPQTIVDAILARK